MKKNALIIALLAAAGFMSTSALAADGTITFTGEIKDVTCTINGGGADFAVALPPVQASALANAGDVAGARPFNITLGGSDATCPNGTKAQILFDAGSLNIDPSTGNLKNMAASGADFVEIEIVDAIARAPINLLAGTATTEVEVAGLTAVMPFVAQYKAMAGGVVTAGPVESSIEYTVVFP